MKRSWAGSGFQVWRKKSSWAGSGFQVWPKKRSCAGSGFGPRRALGPDLGIKVSPR